MYFFTFLEFLYRTRAADNVMNLIGLASWKASFSTYCIFLYYYNLHILYRLLNDYILLITIQYFLSSNKNSHFRSGQEKK